nr:ComEC/Rec2 family competence protein [Pseudopontixanthobacter vadosimaris]
MQRQWPNPRPLSSMADAADSFLGKAGFDRAPWLAVSLAAGISAWFALPSSTYWVGAIVVAITSAAFALKRLQRQENRQHILLATAAVSIMFAAGIGVIWSRSEIVGTPAIAYPVVQPVTARVLTREEQPARGRIRLTVALRDGLGIARKIRLNITPEQDAAGIDKGAVITMRARLLPPASPMLPGSYDFARDAWFSGLAATGSVIGPIRLKKPADGGASSLADLRGDLSDHVRSRVAGAAGSIAAAFASGDRGAIADADADAMRDSGLTHLLSISGLHVSAVVAATYILAMRIMALWQNLALRIRLPVAAALLAAMAGVFYTMLTGAEVPTIRSCIGAILVLGALMLGRQALSMRMVAVAAIAILLLWPESVVGPSFQMSFAAVIAIVALHNSKPVREFTRQGRKRLSTRIGRNLLLLFVTGLVIELALMPIVLHHFHRAGVYGAMANLIAIPLVTIIAMPAIALALFLDLAGLGAPAWWLVETSLNALLAIARLTASQAGSVTFVPVTGSGTAILFIAGLLWLALWQGRMRLWGLVPAALAGFWLLSAASPDLLVSGDGRQVAIVDTGTRIYSLRGSAGSYAGENLQQIAGTSADLLPLQDRDATICNADFCSTVIAHGKDSYGLLVARNANPVAADILRQSCATADIVISERVLGPSCNPRWLKLDRYMLDATGGLAIYLQDKKIVSVAQGQGDHGWWREAPE